MNKIKNISLVIALVLTLTGCGLDVVTPEDKASETTGTGAEVAAERTCEINELDRCAAQFQLAQKDINTCMEATQTCEDNLQAYQKRVRENVTMIERLNEIFRNYTETTEQKEYKFDLCGKVGNFENQTWFKEFKTVLEANPVPFTKAGRNLSIEDFTGGCASSEGSIAFFMGAETDGFNDGTGSGSDLFEPADLFEFHLLKYDTANKTIQDVLMADGICDDETCPAIFLSRIGAYIPMSGISKEEECTYKYYFDQNILVKEGCNAK